MATPKPGEIRCPTCHRSTPPAAFCTQCGSAIPSDARIRPRGMDRDELQERIRARRSGGEPYRRGGAPDDEGSGYQRYEPEPDDARARPAGGAGGQRTDRFDEGPVPYRGEPVAEDAPRRDLTREHEDDAWAAGAAAVPTASAYEPPPPAAEEPAYVDNFDDEAYADEPYEYDEWPDERERRSGTGALAILGFLALGVLALLGGAMLAGIFSGDPGIGQGESPSPTPSASIVASEAPSPSPTTDASPGESPDGTREPAESGEPVVFPDGFEAEAQPCLPGSARSTGCDSNAATNSGALWVWVGLKNGTENDVIGAELIGPDGSTVGTGSIELADIGCRPTCPGAWTYFPFSNLPPGEYEVEITRNGEPAGTMTFEVA
jgi:hypothetical protein